MKMQVKVRVFAIRHVLLSLALFSCLAEVVKAKKGKEQTKELTGKSLRSVAPTKPQIKETYDKGALFTPGRIYEDETLGETNLWGIGDPQVDSITTRDSITYKNSSTTSNSRTSSNLRTSSSSSSSSTSNTKRVIIRYKESQKSGFESKLDSFRQKKAKGSKKGTKMTVDNSLTSIGRYVVEMDETELEALQLEASDDIESVETDKRRYSLNTSSNIRKLGETIPYGINMVQSPELWKLGIKGQGVKVCLIDSGIDAKNGDFDPSHLSGLNLGLPWDVDGCSHGTHVAGIVAAAENKVGVVGIAPQSDLLIVRIFTNSCGYTFSSDIVNAVILCKNNGAKIVNLSMGGNEPSVLESETFERLFKEDNVLTIAAAGNLGTKEHIFPASYESVISVGAVGPNQTIASFSQRNSQVDLWAPGVDVSSVHSGHSPDDLLTYSGTSLAAPHVTGVAALLSQVVGNNDSKAALKIRNAMKQTSKLVTDGSTNGVGIVQAMAAYNCLKYGTGDSCNPTYTPPPSSCVDVPDWRAASGQMYNCKWYAMGDYCKQYGSFDAYMGKNAKQACCACGGGINATTTATTTPASRVDTTTTTTTWTELTRDTFESAWGTWLGDGVARRARSSYSPSGSYSIELSARAYITQQSMDVSKYSSVKVDLLFRARGMDPEDYMQLQYSSTTSSSPTWTTAATWKFMSDGIDNDTVYPKSVTIDTSKLGAGFQLRISSFANWRFDYVYLDDIIVSGRI